jgi:hypothetical protein
MTPRLERTCGRVGVWACDLNCPTVFWSRPVVPTLRTTFKVLSDQVIFTEMHLNLLPPSSDTIPTSGHAPLCANLSPLDNSLAAFVTDYVRRFLCYLSIIYEGLMLRLVWQTRSAA